MSKNWPTSKPRTDVEWDSVPAAVKAVVESTAASLEGGKVTRGKVSESYGVYRVVLLVKPEGVERTSHGAEVACNYNGVSPWITARVRLGDRWI